MVVFRTPLARGELTKGGAGNILMEMEFVQGAAN